MSRISLAFQSFFAILFQGRLPEEVAAAFGFSKTPVKPAAPKAAAAPVVSDGALQILGILQRDSRLIDFLMEDISGYTDDQVGAAVRSLHEQSGAALNRYVHLTPVIDGVEGSFTKLDSLDAGAVKLLGNVPANGKAPGGLLRHRGWRVDRVDLPPLAASQNARILAPAEVEVE